MRISDASRLREIQFQRSILGAKMRLSLHRVSRPSSDLHFLGAYMYVNEEEPVEVSDTYSSLYVPSSSAWRTAGCRQDVGRPRECREQGVSPYGISYAWCRIRGLIAPPHNVNMPRQLTAVRPRIRARSTHARTNETGHSVIRVNASVSSLASVLSFVMSSCERRVASSVGLLRRSLPLPRLHFADDFCRRGLIGGRRLNRR